MYATGMSMFAEQTVESVHVDYRNTEKRFLVHVDHAEHTKRLKRSMIEYNSRHL